MSKNESKENVVATYSPKVSQKSLDLIQAKVVNSFEEWDTSQKLVILLLNKNGAVVQIVNGRQGKRSDKAYYLAQLERLNNDYSLEKRYSQVALAQAPKRELFAKASPYVIVTTPDGISERVRFRSESKAIKACARFKRIGWNADAFDENEQPLHVEIESEAEAA